MLHGRLNAKLTDALEKWQEKYSTSWCLLGENRKQFIGFSYAILRLTVPSNGSDMKEGLFKEIEIFLYSRVQYGSLVDFFTQKQVAENNWLACMLFIT